MKSLFRTFAPLATIVCTMLQASAALGQNAAAPQSILFHNVRVFDGTSDRLSGAMNVLIEGAP